MTVPTQILTADQMRALEEQTVKSGTSIADLMQRASEALFDFIHAHYHEGKILCVAGPGNNGGDAVATAILLKEAGWDVSVMADLTLKRSEPSASYFKKWDGEILDLKDAISKETEVILDGIFGFGLDREVKAPYDKVIKAINAHAAHVIAIDMPSGIHTDTGEVLGEAVKANQTLTFEYAKPAHFLLPGKEYCGYLSAETIGLETPKDFAYLANAPLLWVDDIPKSKLSDHKYTNGHLAVIAGSDMTGASRMAADASRYIGTGLVTIFAPKSQLAIYAESMPGCLVKPYTSLTSVRQALKLKTISAILMGPGLMPNQKTAQMVYAALQIKKPLLLDAGALTCFKTDKARSKFHKMLHEGVVLTPHEGEFHKLFPEIAQDGSKTEKIRLAQAKIKAAVLLKGNDSIISAPDHKMIINHNAPAYLATAGSGDVLAGIIAGFMAKGMKPYEAAAASAWLSGVAGSYLGYGLVAEELPMAIRQILRNLAFPRESEL